MIVPRVVRLTAWAVYALIVVTLTHWPRLQVPGQEYRADILIHFVAFGLWAALFTACGFFGPPLSRRNILISWVVSAAYALVDEVTQGIPGLGRVVDPMDMLGNTGGTTLAMLGMLAIGAALRGRRVAPARTDSRS